MNKQEAELKIRKCLALANDRAATGPEKESALEMANKLANKYGFKINKTEKPSTPPKSSNTSSNYRRDNNAGNSSTKKEEWYYYSNNDKFSSGMKLFCMLLSCVGIKSEIVLNGKSAVGINYSFNSYVSDKFDKVYHELSKNAYQFKKAYRNAYPGKLAGKELTELWVELFSKEALDIAEELKDLDKNSKIYYDIVILKFTAQAVMQSLRLIKEGIN